jgi:hypothetical protein
MFKPGSLQYPINTERQRELGLKVRLVSPVEKERKRDSAFWGKIKEQNPGGKEQMTGG